MTGIHSKRFILSKREQSTDTDELFRLLDRICREKLVSNVSLARKVTSSVYIRGANVAVLRGSYRGKFLVL